ncbi:hypothetical protein NDU88_005307 [Pleurodeles waltl]|uniref:Uncharacterized protein n=1 Tax=Pleurodeles waltl TaxID=8319 RepID=A0AAV7VIM3_PLEWA|nr:hypothetical protein NDU88_005307 [Pleurodeles waltl]
MIPNISHIGNTSTLQNMQGFFVVDDLKCFGALSEVRRAVLHAEPDLSRGAGGRVSSSAFCERRLEEAEAGQETRQRRSLGHIPTIKDFMLLLLERLLHRLQQNAKNFPKDFCRVQEIL